MAAIPKRVLERYQKTVPKFQRALKIARDRDVNEADTVSIIQDILAEVFGFEKYVEITSEYAIRGTYCDLAIKMDDKIQYLVEVKAIGHTLRDHHLKQAIDYGANKGVQWVVLTNSIVWELYRIKFERPIAHERLSSFNFLDLNPRKKEDQEKLFLLSRRGLLRAREEYYERVQSVNRFILGALILSDPIMSAIRRDIRKLSSGLKVDLKEIEKILRNEVLKRDVIEGEEASRARSRVRRLSRKAAGPPKATRPKEGGSSENSRISLPRQSRKEDSHNET
ncbi:MAG: restriction endonuclease subunit R [Candidatus Zixiibacteriota bacterium]